MATINNPYGKVDIGEKLNELIASRLSTPKEIRISMDELNKIAHSTSAVCVGDMAFPPYKKPAPEVKGIIYNPPATIVTWTDGTKTVVRCDGNDTFSKEFGLAMAYMNKIFGTRNAFKRLISTAYCPQEVKAAKEAKRLENKRRVEEATKLLDAEINTVCCDDCCTSCTVTDSADYNTPGAFVTGQKN